MKTYFCKLIAPRPSFAHDMSEDEARLMQEHAVYWKACMDKGHVVAFGLVADAVAPYGIAIVEVGDDAEVHRLTADDPVIKAKRGFKFEIAPMPRGAVHPPFASAVRKS